MSIEELFISDQHYNQELNARILPWVDAYLNDSDFTSFDGAKIHFSYAIRENSLGTVVISHGFCEFASKFYEMMYYFYESGYSVFFINQRGHGYSSRQVEAMDMVHVDDFHIYVKDFDCFIEKCVKELSPSDKYYLYSHSMGGAIGTLYLESDKSVFKKAVLSSPMIQMSTGATPQYQVNIVKALSYLPMLNKRFCPGQHGYDGVYKFDESSALSEPRYAFTLGERDRDKHYRTYGGSYGWIRESLNISKEIIKNAKNVQIPVILFQAGQDALVVPEAQDEFASLAGNCKLIRYENSKHEVYNATDEIRLKYLKEILAFFE